MENIHGGDIYQYEKILDFSANINPLGAPDSVKKALTEAIGQIGCYPEMYSESLRKAIGTKYHIEDSQIICGNGAADVIYRYVYAVRPTKIMVTAPCFAEYEAAFCSLWVDHISEKEGIANQLKTEEASHKIAVYPLNHRDFCIKEDILEQNKKEKPGVIFLCNPNNPTGVLIPSLLLEKILQLCSRENIRLFLDECFLDFTGHEEQLTLVGKLNQYPNLFILRAFTKMYAMAGVRLGFGITADTEVIEQMYQAGPPWNVSVLAGASGKAALKEDCFVKETVRYIQKEKEYLYDILDTLKIQYRKSTANYILLKADTDLKERLISEGILIRDCSNYRNLSEGYYRIAVKSHEDNRKLTASLTQILGNK